jgi:hypothetical protein
MTIHTYRVWVCSECSEGKIIHIFATCGSSWMNYQWFQRSSSRLVGPLKGTLAKFLAGQPIAGAAHANLKTITYLWFTHVHPRNHMWLLTPFYVWKNRGMKGKRPVIHVITGVNWSNQHSVGMKPCKEERWNHLLHIWVCLLKIRPYHKRLQNYQ